MHHLRREREQAENLGDASTGDAEIAGEVGYLREPQAKTAALVAGSHSVEHYEVAAQT